MFVRLQKLFSKLIPSTVSHRWNLYKVASAFTALALVVALVPLPRELPSLFAAVPGGVVAGDIVVDDSGDGIAVPGDCEVENDTTPDFTGGDCSLRDAIAQADDGNTAGANRIVFDDSFVQIDIADTLVVDDTADELVIQGNISIDTPRPIVSGASMSPGLIDSDCTYTGGSTENPILIIQSSGVTVEHLSFVGAIGNAINIIDADDTVISENWIGTEDRIDLEPNGLHGICVRAATEEVTGTQIMGNIIVASGHDGIRLEGGYGSLGEHFPVSGTIITSNLIGNLSGDDPNAGPTSSDFAYWPGNRYSGITARIADDTFIQRNVITNNGFRTADDILTPTGDGITLLEANDSTIKENYIGAPQHFSAPIDSVFPWTSGNGGLDGDDLLNIPSNDPGDMTDYVDARNACDGIAIRFYDHLSVFTAAGSQIPPDEVRCLDEDPLLAGKPSNVAGKPSNDPSEFVAADFIGPSLKNVIFNNDIGYNLRNGVFIQSVACRPIGQIQVPPFPNAPNVLSGSGGLQYVQSAQNTIIQNSIFFNDGSLTNGDEPITPATGSGTYGIGIDLEDFATASFREDPDTFDNYWVQHFGDPPTALIACDPGDNAVIPAVQPVNSGSTEVDFNINENDEYSADMNPGFDPDAGANRLQNFPVIDEVASIPDAITGTAPEGSLVELFQVICTDGSTGDILTGTPQFIRENCDVDVWNSTGSTMADDVHTKGHGQGFRFLGNAYVPFVPGGTNSGTWTINPAVFNFLGDNFSDVAPFNGGLVTATATAVSTTFGSGDFGELCWDDGTPLECATGIFPAGVSAQRAGSTGSGGIWGPPGIGAGCPNVSPDNPALPFYEEDPQGYLSCLGSTSEFSANAVVAAATGTGSYSLTKSQAPAVVGAGDTVTYTIEVTNNGDVDLLLPAGSLSDVVPTNLVPGSITCSWVLFPAGPAACVTGTAPDPIVGTDFGTLQPGDVLEITITGTVRSDLTPNECFLTNVVTATGSLVLLTESGSTTLDHRTTSTINPCQSQTGSGSTFEKQVSVDGGAFADADSSATAPSANRGDPVTYSFHYGNQTGSVSLVSISDNFPATLSGAPPSTVTCWINGTVIDNDATAETLIPCGYDTVSAEFDYDSAPGIQPFPIPDGMFLHIVVEGFNVFINHPFPGGSICNKSDVHVSEPAVEDLVDPACILILDPAILVNKSVVVPGSNPAGESSVNSPGPGPEVPAGGAVTYFVDVMNPTVGSTLQNVSLFDIFPGAGLDASGWTCTFDITTVPPSAFTDHTGPYSNFCAINTITGEIDGGLPPPGGLNLAGNQVLHVRLTGKNIPTDASGVLCNFVRVTANQVAASTDSACMQVESPNLTIIKTVDNAAPSPGGTVTYTLQVTNPGSTPALNVVITDDLDDASVGTPLITSCVSGMANITPLDGGIANAGTNSVSWNLGNLNPAESRSVRLTAVLRADIVGTVSCRNVAIAGGSNVPSVNDDATISIPTETTGGGLVDFSKEATNDNGGSDDPDLFDLGDTVKYRVTINNTGTGRAVGLTLRDPIPEEEENLRSVIATAGDVNATELSNDRLQVEKIDVAAAASVTVDYDTSILDDSDFPLDNYDLDDNADQEDEDFYPVDVEDDDIGTNSSYDNPEDALDAPDGKFVSLGEDGEIVVRTSDEDDEQGKLIVDGSGDDFCIMEVDPSVDSDSAVEEYEVEVSQTSDSGDFESVGNSTSNSDCFDLSDADLTWARFVRIIDTSNNVHGNAPGSDIDAVCLLNLGGFVTNVASLYNGATLLGNREDTVLVNFTDAFDDPLSENDCEPAKELRVPAPTPLPPPPLPPKQQQVYYPPIQLPKTGPVDAAMPLVASGLLGAMAWVMRRK